MTFYRIPPPLLLVLPRPHCPTPNCLYWRFTVTCWCDMNDWCTLPKLRPVENTAPTTAITITTRFPSSRR